MTEPEVRPATTDDASAVARIWYHGWRDAHLGRVPDALAAERDEPSFHRRARARVADTLVAEVDGAVVGFTMVDGDEVDQVYVASEHRGSGVAALVLAAAEERLAGAGHATAWLAVVAGNARARSFYERQGWRDDGEFVYDARTERGTSPVVCRRYVKHLR